MGEGAVKGHKPVLCLLTAKKTKRRKEPYCHAIISAAVP